MKKKIDPQKAKPFYVINYDINANEFKPYNVMRYFINEYNEAKEKPQTVEDCKKFIKDHSMYQFWGRCEYEVVLHDWPCNKTEKKIDVHEQIMMNIDTVVDLFVQNIKLK